MWSGFFVTATSEHNSHERETWVHSLFVIPRQPAAATTFMEQQTHEGQLEERDLGTLSANINKVNLSIDLVHYGKVAARLHAVVLAEHDNHGGKCSSDNCVQALEEKGRATPSSWIPPSTLRSAMNRFQNQ